ncbi:MAG: M28 family peptidase [Bacteroidota bacterium]
MKNSITVSLLLFTLAAAAQPKNSAEPYGGTITSDDLKRHLYIIASPGMEGRGTGTRGLEKAAIYIENHFSSLGLKPGNNGSYHHYYPLWQDSIEQTSIRVDETDFMQGRHFNIAARQAINQAVSSHEIVFLGYGIDDPAYSDYKSMNVKGKIVLVAEGEPRKNDTAYAVTGSSKKSNWSSNTMLKLKAAEKNGAAAILVLQASFPKYNPERKNARTTLYPEFGTTGEKNSINLYTVSDTLAAAILGDATLNEIKAKMKTGQLLTTQAVNKPVALNYSEARFKTQTSNVVAVLPGTDLKDEYVIITAHMDHIGKRGDSVIYYGADDDGSGTCAVMEIAEAFAKAWKSGKGPRRSIIFMTVSGEEMGLWGSKFYAENPLYPLDKTTVNLNIDMIGRIGNEYLKSATDTTKKGNPDSLNYVYVIGDDKLSSDLRPISEKANNEYTRLKLDYRYNDPKDPNRFYYRSDHYNFADKGVPIIFYFNGVHKDYHRPTDTPDKINYDVYYRRAQLVFYSAWDMANRDKMLNRDIPLNMPPR